MSKAADQGTGQAPTGVNSPREVDRSSCSSPLSPEPTACLQSFTEGIRSLVGAGCVTLFVPASTSRSALPVLHHCGTLEPLPELRDLDEAQSFFDRRSAEASSTSTHQPLAVLASSDRESGLIALPAFSLFGGPGWNESQGEQRRRADMEGTGVKPSAWLGIRLFPGDGPVAERLAGKHPLTEMGKAEAAEHWWSWLLFLGSTLATHTTQVAALLRDPLTGMADRRQFQAVLAEQLEQARAGSSFLTLLFVNPDEFVLVNERFGHEVGDRCVSEIGDHLRRVLRGSDLLYRYGGVIFAAILAGTPEDDTDRVALRLSAELRARAYAGVDLKLEFSIGYRHVDFSQGRASIEPLDLIRQADQALSAAKRSRGSSVEKWREDSSIEESGSVDRLAGIFTGDMPTDYRNMELLRETARITALYTELAVLAREVVEVLFSRLPVSRIGLFSRREDGELCLERGLTRFRRRAGGPGRKERLDLDPFQLRFLSEALDKNEVGSVVLPAGESNVETTAREIHCYAIALVAGENKIGCIYLEGPGDSLLLKSSDLIFFKDLASQVAVALDRARLLKAESELREAREQALRAELRELQHALSQAPLIFHSPAMKELVAKAQRLADATVLITGATGTGKEVLARMIHQLSARSDEPFVVVDCGAIPGNLIESELFGHEKGAFTGADARRIGRLESAGRGTVLLDEIGELPLETQSRLLRFVQEKQLTRVGGTQVQQTRVRILAATNRDLGSEVAAGRFREDLYYRLRVVALHVPPLRERREDILPLAQHFLRISGEKYQKPVTPRLSDEAEQWLLKQDWPGNVRELKGQIVQAVLLSERSVLTPADFGAPAEGIEGKEPLLGAPAAARNATPDGLEDRGSLWQQLRGAVGQVLDEAAARGTIDTPLIRCLGDEVILRAYSLVGNVGRQAAKLLDLPETTTRRRLEVAASRRQESSPSPTPGWRRAEEAIARLLASPSREGSLFLRIETCLLHLTAERFPSDPRTGAALLGVGRRTFTKRVAELNVASRPTAGRVQR